MLVLDEPTAFLDVAGRIELTIALADLADDGLAVIVATHDLDLALSHADRVWLVNDGTVVDRSPEHLLSTGELTRAFSDGTVEVDTRTGVVRARLRAGQPVVVDGHDLDSLLVRRMVTRLGATVVEPDESDNDPWTISRHDGTVDGRDTRRDPRLRRVRRALELPPDPARGRRALTSAYAAPS